MENIKTVICFSGLPGVGKSAISSEVALKTRGLVLDLDEYKKKVIDPDAVSESIDPPELRWKYYEMAIGGIESLPHDFIIVDEVFHLADLRNRFECQCLQKRIRVFWVEVSCSFEIVQERLRTPRPNHILSPEQAIAMNRMFNDIFEPFENTNNYLLILNEEEEEISVLAEKVTQCL